MFKLNVKKIVNKLNIDERGNALVMALIAVVGVSALAVMSINSSKINAKNGVFLDGEKDLQAAVSKIASIYVSPSHCNTNFLGQPFAGTKTSINICTANCVGTSTPTAVSVPVMAATSTDWTPTSTGLSDKVRVVGISYTTAMQTEGATRTAGIVTITVNFQKSLGANDNNVTKRNTAIVTKTFFAYVVTSTYNFVTSVKTDAANILGCSKGPPSTAVY